MSDSTRSPTVRYETSAHEQTSFVRTRTICTVLEQGVICQNMDFPSGMVVDRTAEIPHFDRSLPVAASLLLLRCFLLLAWLRIGQVSMELSAHLRWGCRWCYLAYASVELRIRMELGLVSGRTGRFLASGVQRLVSLQVAEEYVGRFGGSHGEVYVLRL